MFGMARQVLQAFCPMHLYLCRNIYGSPVQGKTYMCYKYMFYSFCKVFIKNNVFDESASAMGNQFATIEINKHVSNYYPPSVPLFMYKAIETYK